MPRLVDHDERRREITSAARRVIVRGGLSAATFQAVAAEAGISVRLIQYYFGTKRDFLLATHKSVIEDGAARFAARMADFGEDVPPREAVRAIATELLPLDAARRDDAVVLDEFFAASLTGQDIAIGDMTPAARLLVTVVAGHLQRAGAGHSAAALDAELTVAALVGLTNSLIAGMIDATAAVRLVERLLDRTPGLAKP
ncbi:TetR/AcrR family transcriptional regulator [Lolliginicoccus levis]|uniref:TetR/AcrR family transcriptional regulator n=1 Tax=Lolliginicoccus levis TaxID=2919542 RepID=UPI00241E0CC6|nr:TetR/AcrR family transcriptional regulator [Lolliginicoccus levis]